MALSTHEHLAVNTTAHLYWHASTKCRQATATGVVTHDVVYSHTDEAGKTTKVTEDVVTKLLEMWQSQPRVGAVRTIQSTGNVDSSRHPIAMISFKYLRPADGGWEKVKVQEVLHINFERQHRIAEVNIKVTAVPVELNLKEICQQLREAAVSGDKGTLATLLHPELQLKVTDPVETRQMKGYAPIADEKGNYPVAEGTKHTWSTKGMEVICNYDFCKVNESNKKQYYKVTDVYTCAVENGKLQVTGIDTTVVENNSWFF